MAKGQLEIRPLKTREDYQRASEEYRSLPDNYHESLDDYKYVIKLLMADYERRDDIGNQTLGERLAFMLDSRGWSLRHFAGMVDTDHSHIHNIITGKSNPSVTLLKRIADALGIDAAIFLR